MLDIVSDYILYWLNLIKMMWSILWVIMSCIGYIWSRWCDRYCGWLCPVLVKFDQDDVIDIVGDYVLCWLNLINMMWSILFVIMSCVGYIWSRWCDRHCWWLCPVLVKFDQYDVIDIAGDYVLYWLYLIKMMWSILWVMMSISC